jgi:sulfhydrogenase subunit beta (sulfur reductase)
MKVSTQAQLNRWLDALAQEQKLVAPVQEAGKLLYRQVTGTEQIAWGFERTDMSPKRWVFPATEPILEVEQGAETVIRRAPSPPSTAIFGLRPCDARGMLAFDALFLDREPMDGQYARHRQATTLIGLACPQMWDSCFCTVVGGAPDGSEGLDVLLTEVEGRYAVRAVSDRGAALADRLAGREQACALPEPKLAQGLPVLRDRDAWAAGFNDLFWQRLGDSCLGCRVCTFVCPACRCFDVRDEVVSRQPGRHVFERLRAWDACTMSAYRRIAGGHNPRPTQHARLRNRFYCKFMYYPQDFGPLGCVGCGRCIDACPVGIDILEVIAAAEHMAPQA